MKYRDKIIYFVLITLVIILSLVPLVYWAMNPELTQMQVFFDMWWVILIAMALFLGINIKLYK